MGLYRDNKHKFNIYDAPKVAGTTIRSWILCSKYGKPMLNSTNYKAPTKEHYDKTKQIIEINWFKKVEYPSICIKRDPIERFASCYKDKILKEGRCEGICINELLDNFQYTMNKYKDLHPHGKKVRYVWYHFAPQFKQFGKDLSYYDQVFDISEMNTSVKEYLEDKWKINLPQLHTRKGNSASIKLTEYQIKRIKNIYKEDYRIGWC